MNRWRANEIGTASNSSEKSARRKVLGAKPKQAGKKEGGWGEGIFARLLPFPFRLSKGKAEGGFGGNSAFPLRNQIEASPATCPNTWKAEHHRKILFSLKEKEIGRAQNEKSKEYFSVVWRACRAVAGLASLLGVLLKKCSNFVQKTPPSFTFSEVERCCLGAKRLGMVFFRNFEGIFEIQNQSAVGNAEVRTNLFEKIPNPFGIFLLSVFFGLVGIF